MRIQRFRSEGLSIAEISRRTHHDRKTIRRTLEREGIPLAKKRRGGVEKNLKLAPYIPHLQKRMAEGVFNTAVLLDEIRALGYKGGLTVVKQYVRPYRPKTPLPVTVRFETEPGEQAQVDFIDVRFLREDGTAQWLHIFSYVLGYSRLLYAEWTQREDRATFFRCLDRAFRTTGGVPRTVLSDNLPPAVVSRDENGNAVFSEEYLAFARHYGFTPQACEPYRAQTKGKVERTGRYIQQNFLPRMIHTVRDPDVDELDRHLRRWVDQTANVRIHGTTHERPLDRFTRDEIQALRPLPDFPYGLDDVDVRRVSLDGFVVWKTNRYSVPWVFAGRDVLVHETPDGRLWVEFQGKAIAECPVSQDRFQVLEDPVHRQGLLEASKGRTGIAAAPSVEAYSLEMYDCLATGARV